MVERLLDPLDAIQNRAITQLAALIDEATAEEAESLGACMRDFGALEALVMLLDRPCTEQDALRIIGNLASNAVDPHAATTKRLLFEMGVFEKVLERIWSTTSATVIYALGGVQNMCARREYALHMQRTGADVRLRELLNEGTNQSARHFATGCLSNMEAVLAPTFVPDPRVEPRTPMALRSPQSPRTPSTALALTPQQQQQEEERERRRQEQLAMVEAHVNGQAQPRPLGPDGTPLCAVCMDKPVNTALTPCFHAGFCNGCAVTIAFNRFPCPICRSAVSGLQRIYL